MSRRKKEQIYDVNRQIEIGQSPVRLDGAGEDQVVKDLLSPEFATMPDSQVLDISNALREILLGQRLMGERLQKIEEKIREYEKDEKEWETDRRKFIEKLNRKADAVRAPDSKKEQAQAKAMTRIQGIYERAQLDVHMKRKQFMEELKNMPKVTVTSPGKVYIVNGEPRLEPEVVYIKNMKWVLQPGVPTEVPKIVADELEQRRRVEMETSERKKLLMKNLEDKVVAAEWNAITGKYKSGDVSDPSVQFPL